MAQRDKASVKAGESPCFSCDGGCCRTYSVEVTAFDIRRLMLSLDRSPEEFCATIPSWNGRCQVVPSIIGNRPVNVVLRREEDGRGACLFFRGGAKACTVYEHRPRSCAVYPFRAIDGRDPVERDGIPCPVSWHGRVDRTVRNAELAVLAHEIRSHNQLVTTLNSESLGRHELASYLSRLLAALESHLRSPTLTPVGDHD